MLDHRVLLEAQRGFTTRSDFARQNAELVAQAACLGLISTKVPDGVFGGIWSLTPLGLTTLFKDNPHREEIPDSAGTGDGAGDLWSRNRTGWAEAIYKYDSYYGTD